MFQALLLIPVEELHHTPSGKNVVKNNVKLRDDTNQQPSMVILSFHNYKKWNSEEVASTLILDDVVGGASLSVVDVKPLCDAGFKGTSLANIVQDINRHNVDSAIKIMTESKDFTQVSESTCKSVVNWVNNTLMPKLFGLWDKDQTKSALCKQKLIGGAGLHEIQVQPLYEAGFNGTVLSRIVYELEKNERDGSDLADVDIANKVLPTEIDSSTLTPLVEWVKYELIAKNKIQVPLAKPSISNGSNKRYTDRNETVQSTQKKIQQFIQQFTTTSPKDISNIESIPNILLSSFGSTFTFVDREDSKNTILHTFKHYSSIADENKNLDKDHVILPFIAAAPGVGKSRLLQEIGWDLRLKHFRDSVTCYPLFVSFGNVTSITDAEQKEKLDIFQSLIIRIVFSFICHINGTRADFDTLTKDWITHFGNELIGLKEVLQVIANMLEKPNIDFFIAIDEAHEIDNNNTGTNPLKTLMKKIGCYLQFQKETTLRVFPLFAGTFHTVLLDNLIGSTYTPRFVPVTALLSPPNVAKIIDNLEVKYSKLDNWRIDVEFRHYLRLFAGFPRGLEYYLDDYVKQSITAREAYESSSYRLRSKYSFTQRTEMENVLAAKVVTRARVSLFDNILTTVNFTFSEAENRGFIMLNLEEDSKFTCTYPPVLLSRMISHNMQPIVHKLVFSTEKNVYGLPWEDCVHDYLYLFFSLVANKLDLTLNDLFPFATMSAETSKLSLEQISNCTQFHAAHKVQSILKEIDTQTGKLNIVTLTDCAIIKNAPTAEASDILIFGVQLKTKDEILVFHIQCKWADNAKSSETFKQVIEEMNKNKKLSVETESKTTRNITVIMTGKPISDLPNSDFPDDLVIINKTNFAKYFGIFTDSMKFLCAKQILNINNQSELQSFHGLGDVMAKYVIKARSSTGFKDMEDLKKRVLETVTDKTSTTKLINILSDVEIIF
ncbi:hypothetical protein C9374_013474 [Naegleria lovaniensis]|uniref:Uncharacterized protein n=1 Tax=Naegleria lovaniensis TaxID=51637 RepID=A0AA88KQP7_NAELO|nr:uncharacterized protein C9374_013474 [Naegleria lovaniensis]KAG2391989.1 hypothetical protein C9374_013474 [Naegleria lovaniensis]